MYDALDNSGDYLGILISELKGTETFRLGVNTSNKWQPTPKGMDPGLIDEIDKIITGMRAG